MIAVPPMMAPRIAPEQVPVVEGLADTPGARLWFWDTGGDGPVVVLCHPASQSSLIWEYQQPAFAAAGYRVIAYCRRGYYRSEAGPNDNPGTAMGDLVNLLDALEVDQAHVLGAAAGGLAAMALAIAHPERMLSLVLAVTIVAPDEDDWRELIDRLGVFTVFSDVPHAYLELGPSFRAQDPTGFARFAELEMVARPATPIAQPAGAGEGTSSGGPTVQGRSGGGSM